MGASLGGIIFAVTLVMIQAAIYSGFVRSTTLLIDESRATFWVTSGDFSYLELSLPIPYAWVRQARSVPGVAGAEGLIIRSVIWRSRDGALDSGRVIGMEPKSRLIDIGARPEGALWAQRPFLFAVDAAQFPAMGITGVGATGSMGTLPAELAASTSWTQPIISTTFFYTSLANAVAWSPMTPAEFDRAYSSSPSIGDGNSINYVLVEVDPKTDPALVARQLARLLPGSLVLTHEQIKQITRDYWVKRTNIGFLLGLGALLGLVVGAVVVAQILYSSVNEHLREYATLKALGISDGMLYKSILWQAVAMAILGFLPGLALSEAIAGISAATRGVPIEITAWGTITAFLLALMMCVGAAFFAVGRALQVDPALVFKA